MLSDAEVVWLSRMRFPTEEYAGHVNALATEVLAQRARIATLDASHREWVEQNSACPPIVPGGVVKELRAYRERIATLEAAIRAHRAAFSVPGEAGAVDRDLWALVEEVVNDAGLEDDYAGLNSDGRFIGKAALLTARAALKGPDHA